MLAEVRGKLWKLDRPSSHVGLGLDTDHQTQMERVPATTVHLNTEALKWNCLLSMTLVGVLEVLYQKFHQSLVFIF